MPKYRLEELDEELELGEDYRSLQKIKRGQRKPQDQLPPKKKAPKHTPRPDKI